VDEPGPDSGHRLTIDPGKHKGKNDYYYSFKTQFRGRVGVGPELRVETIDPG
jgi:hypothetical protein